MIAQQTVQYVPGEHTASLNIVKSDTNEAGVNTQPHLGKLEKPPETAGQPLAPPDGGLVAWLQVVAGFALFFSTWGLVNTFSVFQTYFESGRLFKASSSEISWIGSIQSFLLQFTGLVAGPLYDRGHLRLLLITGSFMVVFGLMMLSLCTKYWQALLSQAFCIGIGAGLLFTPTVSLIPTWFSSRIGLAVGIASSGSSLGGVFYSLVLYRLISRVGFPWAVRAIGFIALATFIVPLAVMRMRVQVAKPRAILDWTAFRDVPFMLFTLSVLITFVGTAVLLFYISFYPEDRGFTSTALAFYMAAIFNAGSFLGRIIPNALSDHIGLFNTIAPTTLLLGITMLCMLGVRDAAGMIVEAVVTGFFSGVVVALPPVCFRMLTENKSMVGTRVGQGFAIGGFGLLIGGPSAGAFLRGTGSMDWTGLWIYGGVTGCIAGLIHVYIRIQKGGFTLNVKV